MYMFTQEQAVSAETVWLWYLVYQEIGTAISTLEEAGATLVALVDSSAWESDGFRALNELIIRLRDDTGVELGKLSVREWELGEGPEA